MKNNRQQGFGAIAIVALLAIVIAAGLVVWRVLDTNSSANSQTNNTSTQQPAQQSETDPNEGYVVIKEWGVRFKPVSGLTGVTYFRPSGTADSLQRYDFSTQPLIDKELNCATQGVGSIQRSSTPLELYEVSLGEITGYHYYYRGSQAACSDDPSNFSFEIEQRHAIKDSVVTLEATK